MRVTKRFPGSPFVYELRTCSCCEKEKTADKFPKRGNQCDECVAAKQWAREHPTGQALSSPEEQVVKLASFTERRRKLKPEQVRDVRRRAVDGESIESLADEHGVHEGTMRNIVNRRSYKDID